MSSAARAKAEAAFADEGLDARTWSNQPGHRYAEHSHGYHKVLFCISGSIVFHTPDGDVSLGAGDRLDLPPGTAHSATVGDDGVTCMEAAREVG
ncbi:MAG: AraC family ligand binding domain-containing protein [Actinobacteria bacterium]|nr:AraC family ligand binding domain-containing protein [Actinomycetota bacterium]